MIFITGPHNVGKSTLANWLAQRSFIAVETGDIVRQKHQELAPDVSFYDWASAVNEEDPDFLNKCVLEEVQKRATEVQESAGLLQDVVVVGNRQYSGIEFLANSVEQSDKKSVIISIKASSDELYRRHFQRDDHRMPDITPEQFEEYLDYDKRMGLDEIEGHADIKIESGNIEETRREVVEELQKYGYKAEENMEVNIETSRRIY